MRSGLRSTWYASGLVILGIALASCSGDSLSAEVSEDDPPLGATPEMDGTEIKP